MTLSGTNPNGTMGTTGSTSTDTLGSPMRKRSGTIGMGAAIAVAVVLLLVGIGGGYFLGVYETKTSKSITQLTETGSSLLYPLMQIWGPNYTSFNPSVAISSTSSGSGAGQDAAIHSTFNIGGSDAFLKNASADNVLNVPVAISSQLVYYNLNGVTAHLNLNGTLLAMIYNQTITSWTNPLIEAAQSPATDAQLNATSTTQITLDKRSDSSGDTFLFTSLCVMSWKGFAYPASTSGLSGLSGSHVDPETGNSQMVTGVEGQPGAIAYIGISYMKDVTGTGVNYAALGDNLTLKNGTYANSTARANYVLPTPATISSDANLGLTHLNYAAYGLAVNLILGGVNGTAVNLTAGAGGSDPSATYATPYPIVNLEYAIIQKTPSGSTVTPGNLAATVEFLDWAISLGNSPVYLNQVGFIPLTTLVLGYDEQELGSVAV
jgi:phosphate transport system substrate-binding protein